MKSDEGFRSKTERDREVDLQRNYGKIGIAAIQAAGDACRTKREQSEAEARRQSMAVSAHTD
ncbi:hypothetical protein [Mangrovibrevibacter kandeliae]|uniref:hypothetical protein n=1 Tax=Mangrovibrevibacter kandeliae TaxID=2968473 RepID=UPI0021173B96|nr:MULTISPECIES: hypothetical protein [unclassified Aurantimonas]MCQ8781162.1 hypothetical protein [Aurantimonas sp. CSK15Z-1]MCW4113940.1 hypothetical protein [Aurantimonas sp. MSK8Z-1]